MKIINTSNFHQHSRHFYHSRTTIVRPVRFEQELEAVRFIGRFFLLKV